MSIHFGTSARSLGETVRATHEKEKTLNFVSAEQAFPLLFEQAKHESARELGSLALSSTVVVDHVQEETTLKTAVQLAKQGDIEALMTVDANVSTDVAERLFKVAHISSVTLQKTTSGLSQNGRKNRDIQTNALRHMSLNSIMRERTNLEHRNATLFDLFDEHGVFEEHDAVVFEMTPHDDATRKKYNFFTNTDSISTQYLSKHGEEYVLETAMIAGKASPEAPRVDSVVVGSILRSAGVEADRLGDNDSVQHVMLIPKGQANGVQDVVRHYDELAGGTFYGEHKPVQDYDEHRIQCEARSEQFSYIVDKITHDLLQNADTFIYPMDALKKLDDLSDIYCAEFAMTQEDIDLAVFGEAAAKEIRTARDCSASGDSGGAEAALSRAHEVSTSGSCPFERLSSEKQGNSAGSGNNALEITSGKKKMNCPFCKERTVGDPCANEINCTKCSASTRLSASENRKLARVYKESKKNQKKQKGILSLWMSLN